ncbi:MAG: GNAT family N-acetyltransferase [Proteobacteria bacterium]|nr:GNAT family N-acetyltransferase [Pseudomonadota bacterium]
MRMPAITIRPITLPLAGFADLAAEARGQGRDFVDRMDTEWRDGSNRFDAAGEVLFGAFDGERLVGVGGLNRDPYVAAPRIGRLRHLYVLTAWRRGAAGGALVRAVVEAARGGFDCVRLRTSAPAAVRLYEALGFAPVDDPTATHILMLGD